MAATCCDTKISVMRAPQGKWRRCILMISSCQITAGIGHMNGTVNASAAGDAVQVQEGIDREGTCESSRSW
jgi:hypothetical protein